MGAENGLLAFRSDLAGDVTQSGFLWKHRRSVPQLPTPVLYRGVLYMINDGGILTTLDPASGTVLKAGRLRDAVDSYYASPVAGDGKVYFVSRSGIASVLKAGGEQELVSVSDLAEEVAATPALADGRLYLRTQAARSTASASRPRARSSLRMPGATAERVLGIETSCDETAAAVVEDGRRILSNVVVEPGRRPRRLRRRRAGDRLAPPPRGDRPGRGGGDGRGRARASRTSTPSR